MTEEKRIYVVIPSTVQVGCGDRRRTVVQPHGRQIAQACHVVSKLRFLMSENQVESVYFEPYTTIILQARDTDEVTHNIDNLQANKKLKPVFFEDENEDAYGPWCPMTAIAVLATPSEVRGVLDYLPLWGS